MEAVIKASGQENNGISEDRLDALLERLDRLVANGKQSSVTIYQRRFVAFDIANPGEFR